MTPSTFLFYPPGKIKAKAWAATPRPHHLAGPLLNSLHMQVVSASGIVFANKAVMSTFGFKFIYALTLIHTLCTLLGMQLFRYAVSPPGNHTSRSTGEIILQVATCPPSLVLWPTVHALTL